MVDHSSTKQTSAVGIALDLLDWLGRTVSALPRDAQRKLSETLRALSIKLESPHDTIQRIVYSPIELCVSQLAVSMGLFHALADSSEPLTVSQLAEKTKADPVLVGRLCRSLASFHLIQEVGEDLFTASHVTHTLTQEGYEAGIAHHFYLVNPTLQALPKSLKGNGYSNPSDPKNCAFNVAFNTPQSIFEWMGSHPTEARNAGLFLNNYHTGKTAWTDSLPLHAQAPGSEAYRSGTSSDRYLFIDVGGGFGAQAASFAAFARTASLTGKIAVQDLATTLAVSPPLSDIEKQAMDFFVEQPVLGAKFYYMRNVLHDHGDERAARILSLIKEKMAKDSVLLIDEKVVPATGAHPHATNLDIVMMTAVAALERTEKQWFRLLNELGFEVTIRAYEPFAGDSIIECRLA